MNERMTELYAKACLDARDKHFEDKDVPAFIQCMAEKFAELIVGECVKRIEGCSVENPNNDEFVKGYNKGVSKVSSQVKAHFGVE